jgi:hypothetical protein
MSWVFPSENQEPHFDALTEFYGQLDASGYAAREDRHIILSGGGTVNFTAAGGAFSWGSDIEMLAAITGFNWRIPAGNVTVTDGQILYVNLVRAPTLNTVRTLLVGDQVPNDNDAHIIGVRKGSTIYFFNGNSIGDGGSLSDLGAGGGGGGGSALEILDEGSSLTATAVSIDFVGSGVTASNVGSDVTVTVPGGLQPVHYTLNGPLAAVTTPTDFVDGLREVGQPATVTAIHLSQEVDGTGGATTAELYKIDPAGTETLITVVSSLSLAFGGGAKARATSVSFNGGTDSLLATDRLGIKFTAVQTGPAEEVTVSVILTGGALVAPPGLPEDNEVTHATNSTVLGTTFLHVGSVYLPAGIISSSLSRVMLGTDQVADTADLEIRRFTGGAVLDTITATGVLQDAQPAGDINVAAADWYDLYLKADVITTNAILRGLKFVYTAGNGTRIRQAFDQTQTGTTPLHVGAVYLPLGTLQASARCMLGTTAGGTATVELRRFTGGAVITTWNVTGALADAPLGAAAVIPAADWYDLYIYGDAGPTVALVKGLDWTVLT